MEVSILDILVVIIGLVSFVGMISLFTYFIEVGILGHSRERAVSEAKGIAILVTSFIIFGFLILVI